MNKIISKSLRSTLVSIRVVRSMIVARKQLASMTLLILLSGCSAGARTSFQCPTAKGLTCMPVDKIYAMIESGEIKSVENQLACKNKRNCVNKEYKPELKMNRVYEASMINEHEDNREIRIDDTLYVK